MSTETRFRCKTEDVGSSSETGNEESSTPRPPNERKTKRYVKKKGEARKRNSTDNGPQQSAVQEIPEVNKISMKLEKMTIKTEPGESLTENPSRNNNEAEKKGEEKTAETRRNRKQNLEDEKEKKPKSGAKKEQVSGAEEAGMKEVQKKSVNSKEHLADKRQGLTKNLDKGKTVEQRRRDRQTARFAKAVARFSMKFTKAAKELGIIRPEDGSTSWSDGSSTCTDSCSSSCTCSGCCTSDSSTCSCSDCRSENCSTCSPTCSSNGSPISSSSSNSSSSSTSSSTGSSFSEISDRVTSHSE